MTDRRGGAMRTMATIGGGALALAFGATALVRPLGAQPDTPRVRSGVSVAPDTVTVGDPFVVTVRIAAPPGAVVIFPTAPDSASAVALLDPKRETRAASPDVDVTARYRVAAWDVGDQPVTLGDVRVRVGSAERAVALGAIVVHVRSVLPADSSRRVPKPPREPLPDVGLWWLRYALAAVAVVAIVAAALLAARRWWRRRAVRAATSAPYASAVASFDALDAMRLVDAGEAGRHVALATDIVRDYLAARITRAERSLTSSELAAQLNGDTVVDLDRMRALLEPADLIKFAARPVAADDARALGAAARAMAAETERAVMEREAREAAEREAAALAARVEARRYEAERRRVARGGAKSDRDEERPA